MTLDIAVVNDSYNFYSDVKHYGVQLILLLVAHEYKNNNYEKTEKIYNNNSKYHGLVEFYFYAVERSAASSVFVCFVLEVDIPNIFTACTQSFHVLLLECFFVCVHIFHSLAFLFVCLFFFHTVNSSCCNRVVLLVNTKELAVLIGGVFFLFTFGEVGKCSYDFPFRVSCSKSNFSIVQQYCDRSDG